MAGKELVTTLIRGKTKAHAGDRRGPDGVSESLESGSCENDLLLGSSCVRDQQCAGLGLFGRCETTSRTFYVSLNRCF
jgi:hypothetical protein